MESMIRGLQAQIQALEAQLSAKGNVNFDDPYKLKPIDVKDIEKPDKYDNNIAKFTIWYERFRPNWEHVFNAIEKAGKTRIARVRTFSTLLTRGTRKSNRASRTSLRCTCQLKAYLRTYTGEELHARVTQTRSDGIMDLLRDIVHKGKNRNPNLLIELKAKALSPSRAAKTADVDRVLTEWKYVRRQILEEDPNYKLDDETLQTLLMKIIPHDLVKPMRELLTQGRYINDYHGFEQALFDEISTRKMDEDARKGSIGIHAVGNTTEVPAQEDASPDLYQNDIEYETVQIWSEEWQCHISGLAPRKRDRSRSRSRGRDEEEQHSKDKGPSDESQKVGQGSKGRGRPGGPCWTCGGPHFQRECPHASASKGNYPITTAWSSWRPGTFPGPSAAQWNSWLPKPKGKGKGKGKNKGGKGDFKGKGKGHVNEMLNFGGSTARLLELCTCFPF